MVSGGMASLNWKARGLASRWSTSETGRTRLELLIEQDQVRELAPRLQELTRAPGSELQMEIHEGLTIFLKRAPSASISEIKLLLAKPEVEKVVLTVVLDEAGEAGLKSWMGQPHGEIEFHRLSRLHFLSNLEMVWKLVSTER